MTDREHVEEMVAALEPPYFREFVLDIWGLRGFGVAYRYDEEGAEFVAVRRDDEGREETEVVSVAETADAEAVRALSEAVETVDESDVSTGEKRAVAVAKRFDSDAEKTARELGVETVDSARLADLVVRGEYYWTLYRWVALNDAEKTDEPTVTDSGEARLRRRQDGGRGIVLGRATANSLGVEGSDVVRVGGEIAGVVSIGRMLERERDYVAVSEDDADALDAEEGEKVTVEALEAEEARRVYVMTRPEVDAELAGEIWKGYAPHRGTELSQPYGGGNGDGDDRGGGEIRTMALEVLPHDYCYVGDSTDVVVEGYAGARRVFE